MSVIIHRSENLSIRNTDVPGEVEIELRFSSSSAVGHASVACPICGGLGIVERWEVEGPGGSQNTLWLRCRADGCENRDGTILTWARPVTFGEWRDR